MKQIIFISLILFIINRGFADTYTAKSNGYWNSSSTWDKGSVPGANDDVVIDGYYVKLKSDKQCKTVTIKLENRSDETYLKIYDGYTLDVSGNVSVKTVSNYSENVNLFVYGTLNIGGDLNIERASNNTKDYQLRLYISGGELNLSGDFTYDYKSSSSSLDEKIINISSGGIFNCGNDVTITQDDGGKLFIYVDDGTWNISNNLTINRNDGENFEMCVYGTSVLTVTNNFIFEQNDCDDLIFKVSETAKVNINNNCTMSLSSNNSISFDFRLYSNSSWTVGTSSNAGNFTLNYDADDVLIVKLYDGAQLTIYGDLTIDRKNADTGSDCVFYQYANDDTEYSIVTIYNNLILKNTQDTRLVKYSLTDYAILNVKGDIDFTDANADERLKIVTYSNSKIYLGGNILRNSNNYGILSCNESTTLYLNGTNQQVISKSEGAGNDYIRYANVVLNNTSTSVPQFTMEGIAEIRDGYDLKFTNGIVESSSSKYFEIQDNATVSDASDSSYIDGYIHKIGDDAFTFPVGDTDDGKPDSTGDEETRYAPLVISAPSSTSTDFYCVYKNENPAVFGTDKEETLDHITKEEYWLLEPTSGSPTVNVTLSWYQARSGDIDNTSALRIAHWDGSIWNDYGNDGTTGDNTEGTIVVNNVSNFSPFTLASVSDENPLPIYLMDFDATTDKHTVYLKWTTASEVNNNYFIIEKSKDAIHFEKLKTIKGLGNSSKTHHYKIIDKTPYDGISYYRLKHVDFDENTFYSNIKIVNFSDDQKNNQINFQVFPNPATSLSQITISGFIKNTNLKIIDITGKLVFSEKINSNKVHLNTGTFSKGIYILSIYNKTEIVNKKIIIN